MKQHLFPPTKGSVVWIHGLLAGREGKVNRATFFIDNTNGAAGSPYPGTEQMSNFLLESP
jgi:hypothetical protein